MSGNGQPKQKRPRDDQSQNGESSPANNKSNNAEDDVIKMDLGARRQLVLKMLKENKEKERIEKILSLESLVGGREKKLYLDSDWCAF
jgi:hypothetical protein